MKPFTLGFDVPDPARFPLLQKAFTGLKQAKSSTEGINDEDPAWLDYFDDSARRFFLWTETEKGKPDGATWGRSGWDFWSMVHAIGCGDYDLVHCQLVNESKAEIAFNPHGHPFGGTESLRVLGECFGMVGVTDWDETTFWTWEELEEYIRKHHK